MLVLRDRNSGDLRRIGLRGEALADGPRLRAHHLVARIDVHGVSGNLTKRETEMTVLLHEQIQLNCRNSRSAR